MTRKAAGKSRTPEARGSERGNTIIRGIIAFVAALLIAVQVVRNAVVTVSAAKDSGLAMQVSSGDPAVEISSAMTQIAQAAHDRRAVPQSVFAMMRDAATKEPLAPEPFLVRGVQAQLAGDGATAERAFEAAQWRDPRSLPAAYFLADRYFRTGDVERGLRQTAALARLAPTGPGTMGPYLAAYARNPANWPSLRRLFRREPNLAGPAFQILASNIQTAPAVLALADSRDKAARALWLPPLLNTLTSAGQYGKARTLWAQTSGVKDPPLIYDASFSDKTAPPPFNWALTSSAVGLAERQPGGRLHLVFYGQEDGILASQLLLLPPGAYRLSMQLLGDAARARSLNWSIWCDKASAPNSSVALDAAAHGWSFAVPAGCAGQWLKLSGTSSDISQQVDVTIAGLRLERVGKGA